VKHINRKLYYRQLRLKYLCNLAKSIDYKLPEDDKDNVRTCRSVIICEIIVYLLVIVQNTTRCMVHVLKYCLPPVSLQNESNLLLCVLIYADFDKLT